MTYAAAVLAVICFVLGMFSMAVLGTVEGPLLVLPEGWSQVELAAVFVAVSGVVLTGTAEESHLKIRAGAGA